MVALPADRNDGRRFRKTAQDGNISGDGTIVEMCGIKSLQNGQAKRIG